VYQLSSGIRRRSLDSTMSIARDKIVFSLTEQTGTIWMMTPALKK
jgi:hypothetical protein